ncbi:MAG: tryptophanase [Elusimicrobiaceae bacterium]
MTDDRKWKTVFEPYKIKMVEPLGFTTRAERLQALQKAHYNMFNLPAEKVLLDFLSDSGSSAMSSAQWAGMLGGDESYACSRSFYKFEKAVKNLTGFKHVIPVHQGRAAERVMFSFLGGKGKVTLSNSHFDSTRGNILSSGAQAVDLPAKGAMDFAKAEDFKGNMDIPALKEAVKEYRASNVVMCIMTITNNSLGGQPVSMANLREVYKICHAHGIPVFLDAARFAENAMFIKLREPEYKNTPVREIAREIFTYADGCMMSAKKDAFVNMGGFIALNSDEWNDRARQSLILGEGFVTYGGLSGRDLEAVAVGLNEVLDERYLESRLNSIAYFGAGLRKAGVPIVEPTGGHAVFVDANSFLPHIPRNEFRAQALSCALYLEGGIRSVEIGMLAFAQRDDNGNFLPSDIELVRLAVPRRAYTISHLDFAIEVFAHLAGHKDDIKGLKIVKAPKALVNLSAELAPV